MSGDWEDEATDTTQIVNVADMRAPQLPKVRRDRFTLTVLAGPTPGAILPVDAEEIVIGRGHEATARIADPGLSRRHARIFRQPDGVYVEDLGSTNGTFVGDVQVLAPRKLVDGDRVQMGRNTILKFALQDALEQEAAKQLYEQTVRDGLTHVYNRRYLDERLKGEFAFAIRHKSPLALLIFDIDHFKKINDTLGHQAGDVVIQTMATTVERMVRAEDLVARYGGEEFAIVARGIDTKNAKALGERVRHTVQRLVIPWETGPVQITVSVGVASVDGTRNYASADELVSAADEALYRAKHTGRNRVCAAGE